MYDITHNWTVQRQSEYGFSSIACDQTIEQTFNRESKPKVVLLAFLSIALL
jgi:hypothetical protein